MTTLLVILILYLFTGIGYQIGRAVERHEQKRANRRFIQERLDSILARPEKDRDDRS